MKWGGVKPTKRTGAITARSRASSRAPLPKFSKGSAEMRCPFSIGSYLIPFLTCSAAECRTETVRACRRGSTQNFVTGPMPVLDVYGTQSRSERSLQSYTTSQDSSFLSLEQTIFLQHCLSISMNRSIWLCLLLSSFRDALCWPQCQLLSLQLRKSILKKSLPTSRLYYLEVCLLYL